MRLNLLRLVRNIMDGCEADSNSAAAANSASTGRQLRVLFDDIQTLADRDSAVLVRNLASELIRSHADVEVRRDSLGMAALGLSNVTGSGSNAGSGARSRSGPRRNTSYTPPGAHSNLSMPPTPTHAHSGHRPSLSSSAYIEVAATPKRSAVSVTHERDAALYRPRSRDGMPSGTSIPRRASGDTSAAVGSAGSKSRLPRTSTHFTRPSLSSATSAPTPVAVIRSDSSTSNKENYRRAGSISSQGSGRPTSGGGSSSSAVSPMTTLGSNGTRETSVTSGSSKRRSRAPSSDVRWT